MFSLRLNMRKKDPKPEDIIKAVFIANAIGIVLLVILIGLLSMLYFK